MERVIFDCRVAGLQGVDHAGVELLASLRSLAAGPTRHSQFLFRGQLNSTCTL
jgi:hypothetical protein